MELYEHLLFNFASIIGTLVLVIVASFTVYHRVKLRWPIPVNCWFCNNNTKIYNTESDWWRCPSCEQYNGFTRDGDYAYDIPEQSLYVPNSFTKSSPKRRKAKHRTTNLCQRCSKNEEIKILELRTFEPKGFFRSGLEHFKKELEMKYPLCDDCKVLVRNVLEKQSQWLTHYKMLFFKQKSVDAIMHNAKRLDSIMRICLTMLTSAAMFYPSHWQLPLFGVFLQTSTIFVSHVHKSVDVALTFLWVCIGLAGPWQKIDLPELYRMIEWPSVQNIPERYFTTLLMLIIGLTNLSSKLRNTRRLKASFKKLETSGSAKNSTSFFDDSFEDFEANDEMSQILNGEPSTSDLNTASHKKSTHLSRKCEPRKSPSSNLILNNMSRDYSDSGKRHVLKFDGNYEQYSLNDSLSTLKTLSLGETRMEQSSRVPKIFATRVYGSRSPDLFNRMRKTGKKMILAPPKLKSYAQTSWVAGGYWQVGVDSPTLSRSSSQSSGFGSAGSNFGPSREPSVSKEIDKCSVISDNTQFCYPPRPNSVNVMNTCCQHGSAMQFARCENSVYNQSPKIMSNPMYMQNSQSHFSPVRPESNSCYERCLALQTGNIHSSVNQQSHQLSSFQTVSNSQIWFTIVLCGSLVFNIAVFCTIMLR